jgi:AI-2E family transporter
MGRQLGISSVVVLFSLLFWGWLLGPIGLFLSVPQTMALAVALDASPHARPIAICSVQPRRDRRHSARDVLSGEISLQACLVRQRFELTHPAFPSRVSFFKPVS